MSDQKAIVRCTDIHKDFSLDRKSGSRLHVLKGIDVEIREGEIVSVVGASGSGKSTLLHILGGLDRPTSGTVLWQERDISALNDESLSKLRGTDVGFIFQFHYLLPEFTALENVMIPLMIQREPVPSARTKAEELLKKVSLQERMHHKPAELSGGEQQRVAVARALANRPSIVFADEPSGNLDSRNSEELHDLILELNSSGGQTFLIVTHNEKFADHSDRLFRMVDGKLHQI